MALAKAPTPVIAPDIVAVSASGNEKVTLVKRALPENSNRCYICPPLYIR